MSTCRVGHEIPDANVSCPTCTYELNRRVMRAHQGQFLATASTRSGGYLLTRRAARGVFHVQQFGTDFTFCDERVVGAWKQGRVDWDVRAKTITCTACLETIDEIRIAYAGEPVPIDVVGMGRQI